MALAGARVSRVANDDGFHGRLAALDAAAALPVQRKGVNLSANLGAPMKVAARRSAQECRGRKRAMHAHKRLQGTTQAHATSRTHTKTALACTVSRRIAQLLVVVCVERLGAVRTSP
jgi:hypothetical protein